MTYHLTPKSGNSKTGPIAVTTSTRNNCPPSCPLLKDGSCYAQSGFHLRMHWDAVSAGSRGTDYPKFLESLRQLPADTKLRHNQAGDLPGKNGRLNKTACVRLADATAHLNAFTYTHYRPNKRNLSALESMSGLVVNLSADNLAEADLFADTGLPTVATVPEDHPSLSTTPKGRPVVVCPEQTGKLPNCEACMLCAKPDRDFIIAFRAHGAKKRLIDNH